MPTFRKFLKNNGKPYPVYNKYGDLKKVKDKFGEFRDMYYPDIIDAIVLTDEYYVDQSGKKYPAKDVTPEVFRKHQEDEDPLKLPCKIYEIRVDAICEFNNPVHFQYFWDKYGFCDEVDESGNLVNPNVKPIPTAKDWQMAKEKGLTYDKRNNLVPIEYNNDSKSDNQVSQEQSIINQQQKTIEDLQQQINNLSNK